MTDTETGTETVIFEVPCAVSAKEEIPKGTFCFQTVEIKSYYVSS